MTPLSEALFDPIKEHCSCPYLGQREMEHLIMIGDERLRRMTENLEMCVKNGLIEIDKIERLPEDSDDGGRK